MASRSSPVSSPLNTGSRHREKLGSDIPELDLLLGGGIEEGTSTLIVGAAGTGKSTLASQFAAAAAARGQHVVLFLFDETVFLLHVRLSPRERGEARPPGSTRRAAADQR